MHYETKGQSMPFAAVVKRQRTIRVSPEDWSNLETRCRVLADARAWATQVPTAKAVAIIKVGRDVRATITSLPDYDLLVKFREPG